MVNLSSLLNTCKEEPPRTLSALAICLTFFCRTHKCWAGKHMFTHLLVAAKHCVPRVFALFRGFKRHCMQDVVETTIGEPEVVNDKTVCGSRGDHPRRRQGRRVGSLQIREAWMLTMDWMNRQIVFVKFSIDPGIDEQGRLQFMKWMNTWRCKSIPQMNAWRMLRVEVGPTFTVRVGEDSEQICLPVTRRKGAVHFSSPSSAAPRMLPPRWQDML